MNNSGRVNIFKNTDYGCPIIYHKTDYRTANARAHRFCSSVERKFVPKKSRVLCQELKSGWSDYRPKSESSEEFLWKINSNRSHREEFAPSSSAIHYTNHIADKITLLKVAAAPTSTLKCYRSLCSIIPPFVSLPRTPKLTIVEPPKIEHAWRESHFTDTEGYFPYADQLVSTTELNFIPHSNYSIARTNLIIRKELPFNADDAFMIPKSRLIKQYPLCDKYCNKNVRDVAKFIPPSFDRIIPNRSQFVRNFGLTTEMTSNY